MVRGLDVEYTVDIQKNKIFAIKMRTDLPYLFIEIQSILIR